MKCQHGQMIQKFCINIDCQYKTAGGCIQCITRNHSHNGKFETLDLNDVTNMIKRLNPEQKNKQSVYIIKEEIEKYLQGIKIQLNRSIQRISNSMCQRIQKSYLYKNRLLQTHKKLQQKLYNKITNSQLNRLNEEIRKFNQMKNNDSLNVQKQWQKCYKEELQKVKQTVSSINKAFDNYQQVVKDYDNHFTNDLFLYNKIMSQIDKVSKETTNYKIDQIKINKKQNFKDQFNKVINKFTAFKSKNKLFNFKQSQVVQYKHLNITSVNNEEQNQNQHQVQTKLQLKYQTIQTQSQKGSPTPFKIKITQKISHKPQLYPKFNSKYQKQQLNRSFDTNQKPKLLSLAQYKNQKTKSTSQIKSKNNFNLQLLNVKGLRQRRHSANMDNLGLLNIQRNRLSPIDKSHSEDENSTTNRSILSIQVKSPIQKLQYLNKNDKQNMRLKNHNYFIENNKLMENQYRWNQNNQIQIKHPYLYNEQNDINRLQQNKQKFRSQDMGLLYENLKWKECHSQVQVNQLNNLSVQKSNEQDKILPSIDNQIQSPHFIKRIQFNFKNNQTILNTINNKQNNLNLIKNYTKLTSHQDTQQEDLNDSQLQSVILLLQSIKFQSKQAIHYLRKSFQYCDRNLSTAQYLSYLLLQQNHPKQCLQLCNYILSKSSNSSNTINMVHIINNKAAALNLLGRFSQTIQYIQKQSQYLNKDTIYKNLADAYFSLGITQKSILYYIKSIQLNPKLDEVYYNLAVCYYTQNHYRDCYQMVSQAIKLNPQRDQYIQLYRNTKNKLN